MSQSTAGRFERFDRFELGGVDQIGYVVADLETSMPHYEALFGPFQVYEAKLDGALFRGKEIDCKLKIATNNEGPIEIAAFRSTRYPGVAHATAGRAQGWTWGAETLPRSSNGAVMSVGKRGELRFVSPRSTRTMRSGRLSPAMRARQLGSA